MKIVINACHGGFGLSEEARKFLKLNPDQYDHEIGDIKNRSNPSLVRCVEELGDKASDNLATLMFFLKHFKGHELLTTTLYQDIEINFVPIETEPRITQEQHQQGLDRLNYLKQLRAVESDDLVLELEE